MTLKEFIRQEKMDSLVTLVNGTDTIYVKIMTGRDYSDALFFSTEKRTRTIVEQLSDFYGNECNYGAFPQSLDHILNTEVDFAKYQHVETAQCDLNYGAWLIRGQAKHYEIGLHTECEEDTLWTCQL